jgi:hypothetical protein
MISRRLSGFIDALADGRRPRRFRATPDDAEVLRTAITLRAARPGDGVPDEGFVSELYEELAKEANGAVVPIAHPGRMRHGRAALVSVAAGVALVGGTVAATEALTQAPLVPAAIQAPRGKVLRTGTFETVDNRVMGQIVAYGGSPSWVYMNVGGSHYSGPIVCKLQVENGSTVATGAFRLHNGEGVWSKTIHVNVDRLRGAQLVTSSGAVVASATFA